MTPKQQKFFRRTSFSEFALLLYLNQGEASAQEVGNFFQVGTASALSYLHRARQHGYICNSKETKPRMYQIAEAGIVTLEQMMDEISDLYGPVTPYINVRR